MEVDYKIPHSKDGNYSYDNLQLT
ncbi:MULTISPECIES: HNH endonuclease [unclassified Nostoc]